VLILTGRRSDGAVQVAAIPKKPEMTIEIFINERLIAWKNGAFEIYWPDTTTPPGGLTG